MRAFRGNTKFYRLELYLPVLTEREMTGGSDGTISTILTTYVNRGEVVPGIVLTASRGSLPGSMVSSFSFQYREGYTHPISPFSPFHFFNFTVFFQELVSSNFFPLDSI